MNGNKPLHVVVVPYPVQGHVSPSMQLAQKLIAHDHNLQITFVNNRYNHERLIRANGILNEDTDQHRLKLVCIEDGLRPDFDYKDIGSKFFEYYSAVQNIMFGIHLRDLLISLTDPAPDLVILGAFSDNARRVAAELNIPSVLLWTQSSAVLDIYLHVQDLVDHGFIPYSKLSKSEVISYIPGIPPIEPQSITPQVRVEDTSDFRFRIITEYFNSVHNYSAILINSFEHLEHDTLQAVRKTLISCNGQLQSIPPILPVGPLLPDAAFHGSNSVTINNNAASNGNATEINSAKHAICSGTSLLDEDVSCIQWLDTKPKNSVVYVSFGSVFNPSVEHIRALAMGIKASKQPFLWVVRPRSSVDHVSELFPEGFLEENKQIGLVISWAPQLQVLSHPSVGVFVTHCGWNSSLETISMGVPVITFPVSLDQPTNSKFLTDVWKIGICIAKYTDDSIAAPTTEDALHGCYIDSKDVEMAITVILKTENGKKMRQRAKALQEAAIKAVGVGGTSFSAIAKLIQILRDGS